MVNRNTLAMISLLALTACSQHGDDAGKTEPRVAQARTGVVALATAASHHASPAIVVAVERVEVASRLMGHLRQIDVAEGQAVARGQRLFTVDPLDVSGQVDQARQTVQQAEDAYANARIDHDRYAALLKEEVVSRQQYEKMQLQMDLASSRLAQAKAGLATASGQMRYATVESPIAGVVTKKLANTGDMATPGRPVLVVENPSRLQVETHVPEDVLRQVKPAMAVPVEVDGISGTLEGRVAQISPAADPASHTFMVKLNVQSPALRSGAFARVLFPVGERQILAIPSAALVSRAGIEGVFVVDRNGIAQFRMVRVGDVTAGMAEVQAGLVAGERIVTEGTAGLESGDKVQG